jgi:hypothetical protein
VESGHRVFVGGFEREGNFPIGAHPEPSEIQNDGLPSRPYPMATPKSICRENPRTPASVWLIVQPIIMAIAFCGNQIRPHTDYSSNAGQNHLAKVARFLP